MNFARGVDLLRPQQGKQASPITSTISLGQLADGTKAPAGKEFIVGYNRDTGRFDVVMGTRDIKKAEGGGKRPSQTLSDEINDALLTLFRPEIESGLKIARPDIADAAITLDTLRGTFRGLDAETQLTYLNEVEGARNQFNTFAAEMARRIDNGESLQAVFQDISQRHFGMPATVGAISGRAKRPTRNFGRRKE